MNESNVFFLTLSTVIGSTLRVSTPLLFAALGGILSERAGVINIALEGLMLVGAFAGASVAFYTHSPVLGALAAMGAGIVLAAFYALFVVKLKADQIVAGTAINLLAAGITPFLCKILFESGTATPTLPIADRFQSAPIWIVWGLVAVVFLWMRFTASGLWLQFAGEHPEALSTAGIRVSRVRWLAVLASGALAGLGGATLSIFLSSSFSRNMTAGRGFMALAAMIFGKWRPLPTAAACLFFGLADALQIRLQGVVLFGTEPVPVQFIQILPYVVTVLVLAGFVGKSRAPQSLGIPLSVLLATSGLTLLSGCSRSGDFAARLNQEFEAFKIVFEGGRSPLAKNSPIPTGSSASAGAVSTEAQRSAENSELLRELYRVVFLRDPSDKSMFGSYVDSLNQGASLEGLFNGFTHSGEYRSLELDPATQARAEVAGSVPKVVQVFGEELAQLESNLPEPTSFREKDSLPLAEIEMPKGVFDTPSEISFPAPGTSPGTTPSAKAQVSAARYEKLFAKASVFTLKRVLSDEALQVISAKAKKPGQLADWYAQWVVRTNSLGVDFGLPLRNRSDLKFHHDWALKSSQDRLTWEVLNRLQRLLNAAIDSRRSS